jgi:hypothetical protein
MGQEWRDPGVLRLHRDFVQSQMCSLAERASEIARSLSQPWMRLSRKSKPQQGVRPGLATNPA